VTNDDEWWRSAVVYQVYPRSFADASGDGIGDLEGFRRHLDHLLWLGVDAVWLSPFYRSPMADFGYDVSDYLDVDPLFGSIDDFERIIAEAHALGLKVILDYVPNHTSDLHPWFLQSRSSRDHPKREWYWWRDGLRDSDGGVGHPGSAGRLPNNWLAAFRGVGKTEFPPCWTWDASTAQWYLHLYLDRQPDLNWNNPEVREAMLEVLEYWLELGVDGFRVDAVHAMGKDPNLADLPPDLATAPACAVTDDPSVHPLVVAMRSVLSGWTNPRRVLIGETYLPSVSQIAPYYGTVDRPELDLAFNFQPLRAPWDATVWRTRIDEAADMMKGVPAGAWPTWVLSNHDISRHRTRYGGSESRARAAALLLLTQRGTPFLYAGEEIGLEDAYVPPHRQVDPGGRDGCRAPLPWDATPGHGWAGGPDAWLPWPPEADSGRTVAEQAADPTSMLHLYRNLLLARRGSEALRTGSFAWIESPPGVLAYLRESGSDCRVAAVNFVESPAAFDLPEGRWRIEVSSGPGLVLEGHPRPLAGRLQLGPDEAVVLRPR
jgi:alpha-glucosidase